MKKLTLAEFPFGGGISLKTFVEQVERDAIYDALHLSMGDRSEAARLLGIKRSTFLMKKKRLDAIAKETPTRLRPDLHKSADSYRKRG